MKRGLDMEPKHIQQLSTHKKSNIAVLLGSGKSINDITDDAWDIIKTCDTWAVNNWVYHPTFVPDFYHVETKWYGYDIMKRRFEEKKEQYKNTIFIFPKGKTIKMKDGRKEKLHEVVPQGSIKYHYPMIGRDNKRTDRVFNANYVMHPAVITKSYDMSMTSIFELLYRSKYDKIITFGIDLNDSFYFWTGGDKKYGEVHHQTNKAHENKPPERPHATQKIQDFVFDFNNRWMIPNGKEIFVGNKDSDLCKGLRHTTMQELVK